MGCSQWRKISMGTCFVWCAAGHCFWSPVGFHVCKCHNGLKRIWDADSGLIAFKTHLHSKRILINWATGPGKGL